MIGRLKGIIIKKQPPALLIDVQGVGYELLAPMTTFYHLPNEGIDVSLHTHLSVREDAHQLFAFHSEKDRELFRTLIKVSGVGPKLALTVLSSVDAAEFVQCVANNDVSRMVKMPGIGKKTAERLMMEMRDKLKDWDVEPTMTLGGGSVTDVEQEAVDALIALGYKPQEASKSISKVSDKNTTVEEIIRQALQGVPA